ncbi:MAG: hypothetical protein V4662_08365 [Verrucomicrobiota bacterium]
MKTEHQKRLFHLFTAHASDTLTGEEHDELQETLRRDAEARALWFVHQDIEVGLHAHLGQPHPQITHPVRRSSWTSWRPLTAAAAGLALGLFSATLVLGYVVPSLQMRIELFSDSFESGTAPLANGKQPLEIGHWGGDYTELTPAVGRIKPATGQHMLRFVRADYEGQHLPESFSSDSFQLLDLRPYKKELTEGTAVVRLSALFNGDLTMAEGPFSCVLKLYALDAELVEQRRSGAFTGSIRERMLANSSSTRVRLDANPATWQKAGNELRLPPGTDYLMIQVGMTNDSKKTAEPKDAFPAHYVDRVQVVLAHVPEVTLP